MSSAISYIIGPVGFLVMGVAVYKSFKDVKNIEEIFDKLTIAYGSIKKVVIGDYKTATICFNYIAAMRTMIPQKYKNEINQEQNKVLDYESQKEINILNIINNNKEINSHKEEITNYNNEIEELQSVIDNLKNDIQNKRNQIFNFQSNIKKKENGNLVLRKNNENINNTISNIKVLIAKIGSKLHVFLTKSNNQE